MARKDHPPAVTATILAIILCMLLVVITEVVQAGSPPLQGQPTPTGLSTSEVATMDKLVPEVAQALRVMTNNQRMTVIVVLNSQVDLSRFRDRNRRIRRRQINQALRDRANATQQQIRALLQNRRAQGKVGRITYYWVFNGLAVTATADVIEELAAMPEVRIITPNRVIRTPAFQGSGNPPEPNLSVIGAPALWDLGYRGQGVVVANMDTGVDLNHPDLSSRWRGGTNSWFDPNGEFPSAPNDVHGHGTWTMGVMVGGDAGGSVVGVAPDAQWIAVRIFNNQGESTVERVHQGFQWLLDPDDNSQTDDAPDVVNNSWTFGSPGCDLEFQADLIALRAAGILPVFAAGNYGPNGSTSASPSNNPAAFAVGGTTNTDLIYTNSSRGPSNCGEAATIFPELVAPGVGIRTTDLFGLYANPTGTSLAAPHTAGGLALLLSAFPNSSVADQEAALLNAPVDLGSAGPDNNFGYGRLDLLTAYQYLLANEDPPTPTATNTPLPPTSTPLPPTATNTPLPPTSTPLPPTPTNTPLPPTATNTPVATPGNSLQFDGDNDRVSITNIPLLSEFTIEAWVQRTADSNFYQSVLSDANSNYGQVMFTVFVDGGNNDCSGLSDQFAFFDGNTVLCSGVTASLGSWYHLAISRDSSGTLRFFVDGSLSSSEDNTPPPSDSAGSLTLGRAGDYNGEYFAGLLDEIRISNAAVYVTNFTPPTTPLPITGDTVALWHLDEGSGQVILDSSTNGRNGTLGANATADSADPTWATDTPVNSSTPVPTATNTPLPPTSTPLPPTPTNTPLPPTSTPLPPTPTNTPLPPTSTPLPPTPTNTPLPPTNTPLPPTPTNTPLPPTNTPLPPTATNTPLPATSTPLPPTATNTPLPPTSTPLPPTATNTPLPPTSTPLPPTPTNTPLPPTATNTPVATPGNSLQFDGDNDRVSITNIPLLSEFTIEAWVQRTADSNFYQSVLSDANSNYGQVMFTVFVDGGNNDCSGLSDQFAFFDGNTVLCSGVTASLGSWYHLAISRDSSGTLRFFVDGSLSSSEDNTPPPSDSAGSLTLGRAGDYNGEYFAGLLDEIRISNAAVYVTNFTPPTTPLPITGDTVALWHLDEGSGQVILDSSTNGRNGTLGANATADSADPTWATDTPVGGN